MLFVYSTSWLALALLMVLQQAPLPTRGMLWFPDAPNNLAGVVRVEIDLRHLVPARPGAETNLEPQLAAAGQVTVGQADSIAR